MFADSSLCSIWDTLYTCPPWLGTLDVLAVGWRNTLVLSNLVFSSLSLQVQMPRNLKVSICILQNVHDGDLLVNTCLQEITMHICIFTHFLSSALMHIAKLHVAHLAYLSCVLVVVQNHNLWKSCTLVGGACVLHVCQSFRDNSVFLSISFDVLFSVILVCCHQLPKRGRLKAHLLPGWFW